jgi:DNA-binding Lrp family transcriptional regulator
MLTILDKQLIAAIQKGLPLTAHPYATVAQQINQTEAEVIRRIKHLKDNGTIKRLGVVVKHRALGFKANAMVVWDIPDKQVKKLAKKLAEFDCVTLCYQRPRRLPNWSYNLFTMIHGKDRKTVLQHLEGIIKILELQDIAHEPLFSTKQFKQRGGYYLDNGINNSLKESLKNNSQQVTNNVIPFCPKLKDASSQAQITKDSLPLDTLLTNYSPVLRPSYG